MSETPLPMLSAPKPVLCPLCGTTHAAGVILCDECGHDLRSPVDLEGVRREIGERRSQMLLALAATAAMIALNGLVIGRGGALIVTAPIGWFFVGLHRWRKLRRWLAAQPPPPRAPVGYRE